MRSILIKFSIMLAALLAFCSCDLEKEGNFTFKYNLKYYIHVEPTTDEAVKAEREAEMKKKEEALKAYFNERIDFKGSFSLSGKATDCMAQAHQKFIALAEEKLIHEEVLGLLGEKDIAELGLYMLSNDGTTIVSAIAWYHTDDNGGEVSIIQE